MGKTLPPRQLKLYQAIDEILWRDWDPIGVSGIDGARDEYQMYLPEVYRLALEGDRSKIVDYLFWAIEGSLGWSHQRQAHPRYPAVQRGNRLALARYDSAFRLCAERLGRI
jgi:hypothetical protein